MKPNRWGTPKLKARCATSGSRSTTLSRSPRRSTFEVSDRAARSALAHRQGVAIANGTRNPQVLCDQVQFHVERRPEPNTSPIDPTIGTGDGRNTPGNRKS